MNEDYDIEVGGTWDTSAQTTWARVWGRDEQGAPVIVAKGAARVKRTGDPLAVMIEGWRPADRASWDRVGNDMAPPVWMVKAQRSNTASSLEVQS